MIDRPLSQAELRRKQLLNLDEMMRSPQENQIAEGAVAPAAQAADEGQKSFAEAFKTARSAGMQEFVWKGKRFHTKTRDEMMAARQQAIHQEVKKVVENNPAVARALISVVASKEAQPTVVRAKAAAPKSVGMTPFERDMKKLGINLDMEGRAVPPIGGFGSEGGAVTPGRAVAEYGPSPYEGRYDNPIPKDKLAFGILGEVFKTLFTGGRTRQF